MTNSDFLDILLQYVNTKKLYQDHPELNAEQTSVFVNDIDDILRGLAYSQKPTEPVKEADVPAEKYHKLERENIALRNAVVKLILIFMEDGDE